MLHCQMAHRQLASCSGSHYNQSTLPKYLFVDSNASCTPRRAVHRPRHTTTTPRAAAQHEPQSTSACPFAPQKSDGSVAAQPAADFSSLSGPGWSVLPQGNTARLPAPQGKWCWNPVLGEFGEFEKAGAGAFLLERFKKFGPVFTWKLGNENMVAVCEYNTVKSLLQNADSKVITGWNPPALYAMLGEGAKRNLEDPANRALSRKLMAPGFSKEALRGYFDKIEDICVSQLDAWCAAGSAVDLIAEGKALSFEFSTQLLVDFEVPDERKAEMKRKLDALFQGMFAPPIKLPGTRFSKGLAAKAELQADIIAILNSSTSSGGSSVFQYNVEARRQTQTTDGVLTPQQLADAGIGLIIAGNDTSGLGMTALLAILPLFPEVMQRLRQEQQEVIAKHGTALSTAAVDSMPYADAVVREVLRVAPPSTQVMRRTLVDMEICGKFVPAGSKLYLSTLLGQVLTDPKLNTQHLTPQDLAQLPDSWYVINADTLRQDFHPERWLQANTQSNGQPDSLSSSQSNQSNGQGNGAAAKPSGLLTFSVGPHVCLGLSLYMTEAKVLLALLARGCELKMEEPEGLGFDVSFVTQLKSRSCVRVSKLPAPVGAAAGVPAAV